MTNGYCFYISVSFSIIVFRKVNILEDFSSQTLPPTSGVYSCTPSIPNGGVTNSGLLLIESGLDSSASQEYVCVSNSSGGEFIIDLTVFGRFNSIVLWMISILQPK